MCAGNEHRQQARANPSSDQESDEEPTIGWAALQSLGGRAWDSLGGGEHGLVGTNTFMHQARYATALHDAEVDVPRLQGARVAGEVSCVPMAHVERRGGVAGMTGYVVL